MSHPMECAKKRIIKKRGYHCTMCGYDGGPIRYLDLHHIIPRARGGATKDYNLIFLCEKCHAEAHGWNKKKWIDPFRENWEHNHGF